MKIEKVNEQQIRCTLTREDLLNRELKISELAYGTEKAKSLFRDLIQQAAYECGFEAEDIPLMIEAIPLNAECIVLIVTKMEAFADSADEVLNLLRRMNGTEDAGHAAHTSFREGVRPPADKDRAVSRLYSFRSLREVSRLARVAGRFRQGSDTLYKDENTGAYLLLLDPESGKADGYDRLCCLISEYAKAEKAESSTRAYLEEHCDPLIKDNALEVLAGI